LERASLSPQGPRRSSDSGSSIGARMAQMCVGQPRTPTNVVWKGGLVRNLPDRDQKRGPSRSIIRPTTADSLGDAACAVIEEVRPEVVSFHFGLPEPGLV